MWGDGRNGGNGGNLSEMETEDNQSRTESVRISRQDHGENQPPVNLEIWHEPLYARFRKMKPAQFAGSTDPLEAEEWLSSIEIILDFM